VTDARVRGLLLALPSGEAMWLSAAGRSLWPFIRGGDSLRVQRCAVADVALGDLVVIDAPHSLVAHVVVALNPVVTASTAGVRDAPAPVLARVIAVRRSGRVVRLPRSGRYLLRLVPPLAVVLKRVPLTRRVVRWLRG
jgi:hypothetical protein